MISASSRAFALNRETTTWKNRLGNAITRINLPDLARYASIDGVFGKDNPELKNFRAWYDRLTTRPAYAEHVMVKLT